MCDYKVRTNPKSASKGRNKEEKNEEEKNERSSGDEIVNQIGK